MFKSDISVINKIEKGIVFIKKSMDWLIDKLLCSVV